MKRCFKCGETKPPSEFYEHPQMGDGHLNKCKDCTRIDVRANRRAKIDHYRTYDCLRFRKDPKRRAAVFACTPLLRQKYPEKYRARLAVANALRRGDLIRKPCEVCGSEKSEAHHDDYSKPLEVRWLCRRDHEAVHHSTAA